MTRYFRTGLGGMLAILLLLGIGCSPSKPTGEKQNVDHGKSRLRIAAIPKSNGGEFWETVERGAKEAAQALDVDLHWEGPLTEQEIAEQNKIIDNMINLGVDGIALAPLNPHAMRKSVAEAVDAGIPVVIFDSAVDGDAQISFVATNNEAGGALGGQYLVDKLGAEKNRVLLLRYIQGTASTDARAKGFLTTVKEGGLKVVGDPYPEDSSVAGCKKTAANVLEGLVQENRLQLDGLFACCLPVALGGLAALEDLRKSGVEVNVVFVGFDTSQKLLQALQAGRIDALVSQDPHHMGYLAVETLVKHLRGKPIEPLIDTGVELVTRERLETEPRIRQLVGWRESPQSTSP